MESVHIRSLKNDPTKPKNEKCVSNHLKKIANSIDCLLTKCYLKSSDVIFTWEVRHKVPETYFYI